MAELDEALTRLRAFDRMVCADQVLSARLVHGGRDHLQRQQGPLFLRFRAYAKDPAAAMADAGAFDALPFGTFCMGVVATIVTAVAVLKDAILRPRTLVYGIDKMSARSRRDFRIEGIYRYLDAHGIRYAQVLHARLTSTLLKHLWRRKEAVVYQAGLDFLFTVASRLRGLGRAAKREAEACACEAFPEAERPFVRAALAGALWGARQAEFRESVYRRILSLLPIRRVLAIDDPRHYNELLAAAKALRIPSYAFQHGVFTVSQAGWMDDGCGSREGKIRPDGLVVWSEYWKKELLRLGTYFAPDELIIGGNPKGGAEASSVPPDDSTAAALGVLVPYETGAPKDEMREWLRRLQADPSLRLFFSVRPDREPGPQIEEYGMKEGERCTLVRGDLERHLPRIHAIVGCYSTFLYDMLALRRPVVILESSRTSGMAMVENGLADLLPKASGDGASLRALVVKAAPLVEARSRQYAGGGVTLEETLDRLLAPAVS